MPLVIIFDLPPLWVSCFGEPLPSLCPKSSSTHRWHFLADLTTGSQWNWLTATARETMGALPCFASKQTPKPESSRPDLSLGCHVSLVIFPFDLLKSFQISFKPLKSWKLHLNLEFDQINSEV
jgi:hypothetical protein